MKTTSIALLSIILGAITGLAYTVKEFVDISDPEHPLEIRRKSANENPETLRQNVPQVTVVGGTTHDFGAMQIHGKGVYSFVFQNTGDKPLLIKTKSTTCKCTVSQLKQEEIPPGQSTDVTLEWTPNGKSVDFRQRAEIETNDPLTPIVDLTIHGRVLQALAPVPGAIVLRRLPTSKKATHRIVVYGYHEEKGDLTGYEFLNEDLASHFDVELGLTPTATERAADRFAKRASALQVTIQPGLPLGRIQQQLRLHTNVPESPYLEIPIEGTVVSDISVVGPRFSSERNLLRLGTIEAQKGISTTLYLLVKGPYRETIEMRLGAVDPGNILQVTLGERTKINNGLVVKYPLSVVVPPGTRHKINRLGTETSSYAEIHIQSDHPEVKDLPIFVEFSIQD